jgi:hypothetical protein
MGFSNFHTEYCKFDKSTRCFSRALHTLWCVHIAFMLWQRSFEFVFFVGVRWHQLHHAFCYTSSSAGHVCAPVDEPQMPPATPHGPFVSGENPLPMPPITTAPCPSDT